MIEIIGYLAGILTVLSFIPQLYKSWNTRNIKDLSRATGVLLVLTSIMWMAYGILTNSFPVIITNFLMFFLVLSIILVPFFPKSS